MDRDSFVFRREWWDAMGDLPAQVRAEVYVAIVEYGFTGETLKLKAMAQMAFYFIKADLDRQAHDEQIRRKRAEAGRKGVQARRDKATQEATAPATAPEAETEKAPETTAETAPEAAASAAPAAVPAAPPKATAAPPKAPAARKQPPDTPPPQLLAKRRKDFYSSLVPFLSKYAREMIRDFFDYWSEPNKSRTRMRFEMERTWDTSRRLAFWASRERNFKQWNNGTDRQDHQRERAAEDALAVMQRIQARSGSQEPIP